MTFFTAEDFEKMDVWHSDTLARYCNAKLERDAKVVYGTPFQANCSTGFHEIQSKYDTHRALLICVEEIERKPCIHVGSLCRNTGDYYFECTKCGERLKPTAWEVLDEQR